VVEVKPGTRLRSSVCDAEFVVVKATGDAVDLRCGGHPLVATTDEAGGGGPAAGFDGGSLLGKRYVDDGGAVELLCTKPGPSSLSLGDQLLVLKDAKPLPSSD
jgi:hypothetical protein